jgi:hypothetical protein
VRKRGSVQDNISSGRDKDVGVGRGDDRDARVVSRGREGYTIAADGGSVGADDTVVVLGVASTGALSKADSGKSCDDEGGLSETHV